MNNQSGVRGVLLAALVPLMMWTGTVRAQQPGNYYGPYSAPPRAVSPDAAMAQGMTQPPSLPPGAMYDSRMPTRPYGNDYPPQPMNGAPYMMPAGGTPGMPGGPALSPMPSPLPTGPMPTPIGPNTPTGPAFTGPSLTGPMPTMTEPPYSSYPMNTAMPSGAASGCANGSCGAGGCGTGGCGSGVCGTGGCGMGGSGYSPTSFFENLYIFAGLDGARGPEDLGINANVGGRAGVATVMTLLEDPGIALEVGTAINYHATATTFQRENGGPGERHQHFSTIALFQRACNGLLWGVAWDYLDADSYSTINASQWRGQVGWKIDGCNEFGVWGTHRDRGDTVAFNREVFHLRSIDQVNFYYTRYWSSAMTRVWAGVAERHGQAVLGEFPDRGVIDYAFVYGADFWVPLSPCVSLFGQANFITPYDTGVVAAFVGVAWTPAGTGAAIPRSRFAPMFGVANNATFALDARR